MKSHLTIPDDLFNKTFWGAWRPLDLNEIQKWIDVVDYVHAHPVSRIRATLDVTEYMSDRLTQLLMHCLTYGRQYWDTSSFISDFRGAFWNYAFNIPLEHTYSRATWDLSMYAEDLQALLRPTQGLDPITSMWQLQTLGKFVLQDGIRNIKGFHEVIHIQSESGVFLPLVVPRTGLLDTIKQYLSGSHMPFHRKLAEYARFPDGTDQKDFYINLIEELVK